MKQKEADKLIEKFRKICIKAWTSPEYNYPPKTKDEAFFLAIEVVLFLSDALNGFVKDEQ